MDDAPESLENYLARVMRLLIERLTEDSRTAHWGVLDGLDLTSEALLNEVLNEPMTVKKPTWKEIGDALGVSAHAAHRKYRRSPRLRQ